MMKEDGTRVAVCYSCNFENTINAQSKIYIKDSCEKCLVDLHVCKMCRFYDKNSYNECRETSAPRITDKEKANYCDYFELKKGATAEKAEKDAILDAAAALFKKD